MLALIIVTPAGSVGLSPLSSDWSNHIILQSSKFVWPTVQWSFLTHASHWSVRLRPHLALIDPLWLLTLANVIVSTEYYYSGYCDRETTQIRFMDIMLKFCFSGSVSNNNNKSLLISRVDVHYHQLDWHFVASLLFLLIFQMMVFWNLCFDECSWEMSRRKQGRPQQRKTLDSRELISYL